MRLAFGCSIINRFMFLVIFLLLGEIIHNSVSERGKQGETSRSEVVQRLEQDIFNKYDASVIPKSTAQKGVQLKFDLALNQIIDVDKRGQTMSAVFWVRQYWNDYRLAWKEEEYSGVDSIVVQASRLWLPDITLYNNAREDYDVAKESSRGLTIASDGNISRFFPTIYKSSCKLDVTDFPFDDQICTLQLGSWSYDVFAVDLYNKGDGDASSFVPNGEWLLLHMPVERIVAKFRCCPNPFVYLVYKIHIRRRSLYYLVNCFMPCLIMLALTILSFYLPSESGERMGVGITILLSLSIIQLMMSDSLPPTSEIPIIVKYYGLTMSNIFISLFMSCAVLTLYHRAGRPLPKWMTISLCHWGATFLRMRGQWTQLQKRRKNIEADWHWRAHGEEEDAFIPSRSLVDWVPIGNETTGVATELVIPSSRSTSRENRSEPEILKDMTRKLQEHEILELFRDEWKFVSQVLNKLFMWALIVAIASNALYVYLKTPRRSLLTE